MDRPFGCDALCFDCIDLLGRVTIPLSGRRLVHYPSKFGGCLDLQTHQSRDIGEG